MKATGGALGLGAQITPQAGNTRGMLGSGALRRQVLSSCAAISQYACSCGASRALQRSATAAARRSSGSLISWQIQHAQQSTLQPRHGYAAPRLAARSRGICTSILCKAGSPKTVRDIVRELKKGECLLDSFIALCYDSTFTPLYSTLGAGGYPRTLEKERHLSQEQTVARSRGCHHYIR